MKHPKIAYKFPNSTCVLCIDGTIWKWIIINKHVNWYCIQIPYNYENENKM